MCSRAVVSTWVSVLAGPRTNTTRWECPSRRGGRRANEFLRCLDTIWTQDVVEFHGEFYRLPRCRVEPKPVQKPRPPITIGGYGPAVVKRAVELGDGFSGGNMPMSAVAPLVREVREAASALG